MIADLVFRSIAGQYQAATPPSDADLLRCIEFCDRYYLTAAFVDSMTERFGPLPLLEPHARTQRLRLALLDEELSLATELLLRNGISPLLVKGADLARRLYRRRGLRAMGDADVLVHPTQYEHAWQTLLQNGFFGIEPRFSHSFRSTVGRTPEGAAIDLHRQLRSEDTPEEIAAIWSRALPGRYTDLPAGVLRLSPRDHWIYLLQHAGQIHALETPLWILDLHLAWREWLQGPDSIESLAEEISRRRSCAAGYVATLLMGDWLQSPEVSKLSRLLASRLSPPRRLTLTRMARMKTWFPERPLTRADLLWHRYCLRDSTAAGASFAWKRWRRRRLECSAKKDPSCSEISA